MIAVLERTNSQPPNPPRNNTTCVGNNEDPDKGLYNLIMKNGKIIKWEQVKED